MTNTRLKVDSALYRLWDFGGKFYGGFTISEHHWKIKLIKDYIHIFLLEITTKTHSGLVSQKKKKKINSVAYTKAPRLTPEGNKLC